MDTGRWIGRGVLVAGLIVGLAGWRAGSGVAIEGGTPAQRAMTLEAAERFREAGLGEPTVLIRFHEERDPATAGPAARYEPPSTSAGSTRTSSPVGRSSTRWPTRGSTRT